MLSGAQNCVSSFAILSLSVGSTWVYAGNPALSVTVAMTQSSPLPVNVSVLVLNATGVSGGPPLAVLWFAFPAGSAGSAVVGNVSVPSGAASGALLLNASLSDALHFSLVPSSVVVGVVAYPPLSFGANATACACTPHGTCAAGFGGSGACNCTGGWSGTTCAVPPAGVLLPLSTSASALLGAYALVTLNATLVVPPFWCTVQSAPSSGQLFQTANGVTPGAAVAVGGTVTDPLHRLLYLPAPGAFGTIDPAMPFDAFTFTGQRSAGMGLPCAHVQHVYGPLLTCSPVCACACAC
jgi:hypothetical protein